MLEILRRHVSNGDDRSTDVGDIERGKPPSIGLALSGGAARGFAHIGVIRTLVQNGIKPDVITGTSIGLSVRRGSSLRVTGSWLLSGMYPPPFQREEMPMR